MMYPIQFEVPTALLQENVEANWGERPCDGEGLALNLSWQIHHYYAPLLKPRQQFRSVPEACCWASDYLHASEFIIKQDDLVVNLFLPTVPLLVKVIEACPYILTLVINYHRLGVDWSQNGLWTFTTYVTFPTTACFSSSSLVLHKSYLSSKGFANFLSKMLGKRQGAKVLNTRSYTSKVTLL